MYMHEMENLTDDRCLTIHVSCFVSITLVSSAAMKTTNKTSPDNDRKSPSRHQARQEDVAVVQQQESFLQSFVDQLLSSSSSPIEHDEDDIVFEPTHYHHPPQADITFSPTGTNTLSSLSPPRHAQNKNDDERDIVVLPTEVNPNRSPLKPRKLFLSSSLSFKSSSSFSTTSTQKKHWIALPNTINSKVSVTDLIRRLSQPGSLSQQDHQYYNKNNQLFLAVQGTQVLDVLQRLYFFSSHDQLEAFGNELIEKQVLYAWTASHVRFPDAFVVLFPFRDPAVLNNFCQWSNRVGTTASEAATKNNNDNDNTSPLCQSQDSKKKKKDDDTEEATVEDPMDIILRLSRQMDLLCNSIVESNNSDDFNNTTTTSTVTQDAFYRYQIDCCQLQMTDFPSNSAVERVTFALNLFNLIIRHAMLLYCSSGGGGGLYQWKWPQNLRQLKPFWARIGYNVGGEFYSLADLQSSLYGYHHNTVGESNQQRQSNEPKLVTKPVLVDGMPWQRFWCRLYNNTGNHETYYRRPAIRNDPRILFAMSWGCVSSPTAVTAYPNNLHECLQTAAEQYCQQHVEIIIHNDNTRPPTVILPPLLAWHRKDFGNSIKPLTVLYEILPFLSARQLRLMEGARQKTGRLHVEFASERVFNWKCGMTPEGVVAEPSSLLLHRSSHNYHEEANNAHRQPSKMSISVSDLYISTEQTSRRHPPAQGTPATMGLSSSSSGGDIHYSPYHPPSNCHDIQMGTPSSSSQQQQQQPRDDDNDLEDLYFDADGTDYELEDMYDDADDTDGLFRSDMSAITMESAEFDDSSLLALLDRLDL